MMSYAKERVIKARALHQYAKDGFLNSAKEGAQKIMGSDDVKEIKGMLEQLLVEARLIADTEEDLAYALKNFEKEEEAEDGED